MTRVTASEASRNFASVLSRASAGEEFEVTRAGDPVASIGPPRVRLTSAERFRDIMRSAPPIDPDFSEDVRQARTAAGMTEEPPPWPS